MSKSEIAYMDRDLQAILHAVSNSQGAQFFSALVKELSIVSGAAYTLLARTDAQHITAQTLAVCKGNELIDNFSYQLAETPCAEAIDSGVCVYSRDVCQAFPDDQLLADMHIEAYVGVQLRNQEGAAIGLLVALFDHEIENPAYLRAVFQVFEGRVAAELMNFETKKALRLLNEKLEERVTERTEQLQQQYEATTDALQHIQDIYEASPDLIMSVDKQGKIVTFNRRCLEVLGYCHEELSGMSVDMLVPEGYRKAHGRKRAEFFKAPAYLEMGKPQGNGRRKIPVRKNNGEVFFADIRLVPIPRKGEMEVLVTIRDISSELALEESLREAMINAQLANQAKSNFLATMSHEIRTPMNGLLGILSLLEDTPLNEQQQNYLHLMNNSGEILLHIINDILDYSKIKSGRFEFEKKEIDVAHFFRTIFKFYDTPEGQAIKWSLELAKDLPKTIIGDDIRLGQVVNNLVSNAFKFTHRGEITLKVCNLDGDNGAFLNISVSDTGIGMTQTFLDRLFHAFTQADQSTSRVYGGSGLGLAISKEIAQALGGDLSVESREGVGSTFHFQLPYEEAYPSPSHEEVTSFSTRVEVTTRDLSSLRVLIVEDNYVNQIVAQGMLERLGIVPQVASNGREALDLICRAGSSFDLILMDCEMPLMDGFEATRQIRLWEQSLNRPAVHICALTAHALKAHIGQCREAGMQDHLAKPFTGEQLLAVLLEACSNKLVECSES